MKCFLFSCFIVLFLNLSAQQAWTQKKGKGYFQIGTSYLKSSNLHIGKSNIRKLPREVTEIVFSSYNEYGITDKLTAIMNLPFHYCSVGKFDSSFPSYKKFDKGSLSALGNVSTALLYNLFSKNGVVLSAKLNATYNTSSRQYNTGLSTGYDTFILEAAILSGYSNSVIFASGEISTVISPNNFLSRLNVNAQIGRRFFKNKKMLLILALSSNTYFSDISKSNALTVLQASDYTGLYHPKQEYYAVTLKAGYEFNLNWSVWLTTSGGAATNIGAGLNNSIAIGYKL